MVTQTRSASRALEVGVPSVGGWRLYPKAIEVHDDDVWRLSEHARAGACIFNPDALRVQHALPRTDAIVEAALGFLASEGLVRGRRVGTAVALHSFAGCGAQPMHTDYDAGRVERCVAKPFGVLVALEDGTRLCMPDGDVGMGPGDILVFDGDCVHAGAAYSAPNTRVHIYLDSPGVHRPHNETYLVQADEP